MAVMSAAELARKVYWAGITRVSAMLAFVVLLGIALSALPDFLDPLVDRLMLVLFGLIPLIGAITILRGRHARGRVLLDCGINPLTLWAFLINACIMPFLMLSGFPWSAPFALRLSVAMGYGTVFGFIAFDRLAFCEHGIWSYSGLVRWPRIKACYWRNDTLLLHVQPAFPLFGYFTIDIPAKYKEQVRAVLEARVPVEPEAAGA